MTDHAARFHELHHGSTVFLLANCWDAGSARLLEHLGAPAVATTSAGLAWSLGYADGEALPMNELVAAVARIRRVLSVPLSVDMEAGFSGDPATVGENVAAVIGAGGIGINLEDAADPAELMARKIEHARRAADREGVRLFINARTDVYLRGLVAEPERVAETLRRAAMFERAGADGLFVPKVVDAESIREISAGTKLPLNVLAWTGLPPHADLFALGVRRVSAGSAIALAALGRARSATTTFLAEGMTADLTAGAMPFADVNRLFAS